MKLPFFSTTSPSSHAVGPAVSAQPPKEFPLLWLLLLLVPAAGVALAILTFVAYRVSCCCSTPTVDGGSTATRRIRDLAPLEPDVYSPATRLRESRLRRPNPMSRFYAGPPRLALVAAPVVYASGEDVRRSRSPAPGRRTWGISAPPLPRPVPLWSAGVSVVEGTVTEDHDTLAVEEVTVKETTESPLELTASEVYGVGSYQHFSAAHTSGSYINSPMRSFVQWRPFREERSRSRPRQLLWTGLGLSSSSWSQSKPQQRPPHSHSREEALQRSAGVRSPSRSSTSRTLHGAESNAGFERGWGSGMEVRDFPKSSFLVIVSE